MHSLNIWLGCNKNERFPSIALHISVFCIKSLTKLVHLSLGILRKTCFTVWSHKCQSHCCCSSLMVTTSQLFYFMPTLTAGLLCSKMQIKTAWNVSTRVLWSILILQFTCFHTFIHSLFHFTRSVVRKTIITRNRNSRHYFHFILFPFVVSLYYWMPQWPSFPNVINTVSSVDFRFSVLLMRGSISVRERSGLMLVFGGSTVSKPFRTQWFNSLLVCFTISWQSLKCKKDTRTLNINLLLF